MITKIGVVGAGQMGGGIAQVAAASGLDVVLHDITKDRADAGRANIAKGFDKLVAHKDEKKRIPASDAEASMKRIVATASYEDFKSCQFVVEAATEREPIKIEIFQKLDALLPPDALLASNTSSISITRLAAATKRPERFIGMHFMNPVPVMKLVEIIRGLATSDATYAATIELAKKMGKETVTSKDQPGFIVNRILMPMINEAFYALQEGLATPEDIDAAMKGGTNQPMGPLALADFIGLDTTMYILEVLQREIGDPKFRPNPLLRKYVEAGWLGKKSGRGVYKY